MTIFNQVLFFRSFKTALENWTKCECFNSILESLKLCDLNLNLTFTWVQKKKRKKNRILEINSSTFQLLLFFLYNVWSQSKWKYLICCFLCLNFISMETASHLNDRHMSNAGFHRTSLFQWAHEANYWHNASVPKPKLNMPSQKSMSAQYC